MKITIELERIQFSALITVGRELVEELGWIRELLAKRCASECDPATIAAALTDKLKASEAALREAMAAVTNTTTTTA